MFADDQGQNGVSIVDIKCPSCGAPLQLKGDAETVTCQYCHSVAHVTIRRQDTGIEPDGTVRDRSTGYGLFRMKALPGWRVVGTALQRQGTSSRPYIPQVELRDRVGGMISITMGDAGTRNSVGLSMLMGVYGGHLMGVDTTNYAETPDPVALADSMASRLAFDKGATSFRFLEQVHHPDLNGRLQKEYAKLQRLAQTQGGKVTSPFLGIVIRVYELTIDGAPWKLAMYLMLVAVKDAMTSGLNAGTDVMGGFGNLAESIGNLFGSGNTSAPAPQPAVPAGEDPYKGVMGFLRGGGLVGKMKRDRQTAAAAIAQQPQQMTQQGAYGQVPQQYQTGMQVPGQTPGQVPDQDQQAAGQTASWSTADFAAYTHGGTILWSVSPIITFMAPLDDFDAQFETAFLPFAYTLEHHPDIERLSTEVARQEAMQVQQATQSQLARNQAAFEASQAANRQVQAAYDSYNRSVMANQDAHHRQFMASSRAQFDSSYGGGYSAPDYSEAIRGVNTYVTSDGREVEVSVSADRAYENQAGDVIGTSSAFGPGADWTELPRR